MKDPAPEDVYREAQGQAFPELSAARAAAPCSAGWDAMVGNGRVRRCPTCSKQVFNVSGMSRTDADLLLRERAERPCVGLYLRADGTVLTSDCPTGVRNRRKKRAFAVAGVSALACGLFVAVVVSKLGPVHARTATTFPGGPDPGPAGRPPGTPPPIPDVDMTPFVRAGCMRPHGDDKGPITWLDCTKALPPHTCDMMGTASVWRDPLLGGLEPRVPIVRCNESTWSFDLPAPRPPSDLERSTGGIAGPSVKLFVVVVDGKLQVIRTREEFVQRFAPVSTEAAALAFAVALTRGHADFEPLAETDGPVTRLVPVIEGTTVTRDAAAFHVNLFAGDVFGCGFKTVHALAVTVSQDGRVTATSGAALYKWHPGCAD